MKLVDTRTMNPKALGAFDELQIYNGLDVCQTLEIYEKLVPKLGNDAAVYNFELALQAPIMEMMLRGFRVDMEALGVAIAETKKKLNHYEELLDYFGECLGLDPIKTKAKRSAGRHVPKYINAGSPPNLKRVFYDYLDVPKVRKFEAGEVSYPMDDEALEKLRESLIARPIANLVGEIRGIAKTLQFLEARLSTDGRAHTSFNIGGTTTWRLSSSSWIDGTKRNLQNVDPDLRFPFIADDGWKLGSIDLEQAESRMVGWICGTTFNKWKYLDFCEKRDVHTHLVRLVWPELPWTGDDKIDKKLASEPFACGGTDMSRRDRTKRLGHGSNYYGIAKNLAARTFLPVPIVERAVDIYFSEFPEIRQWHEHIIYRIKHNEPIINPFGASRNFLGRPTDSSTHREAIAHGPQSAVAMLTNLGMYRTWDTLGERIRLLLQVHDNILFMYREDDDENDVMSRALNLFEVPIKCAIRTMIIPGEACVGHNWAYRRELNDGTIINPRGLVKWKRP